MQTQTSAAPPAAPPRELWTVNALAAQHSISRRQVYNLIRRGDLEARKLGQLTVIPEASRRAWLDALPAFQPANVAAV